MCDTRFKLAHDFRFTSRAFRKKEDRLVLPEGLVDGFHSVINVFKSFSFNQNRIEKEFKKLAFPCALSKIIIGRNGVGVHMPIHRDHGQESPSV